MDIYENFMKYIYNLLIIFWFNGKITMICVI